MNDALWFIERDYRIRAQRRHNRGMIRFVMEGRELKLTFVPPFRMAGFLLF